MSKQKGLNDSDVVAITNDTKTEFWVHIGFPGYEELVEHHYKGFTGTLENQMNECVHEFIHVHRKVKFEIPEDYQAKDGNTEESKIAYLMEYMNQQSSNESTVASVVLNETVNRAKRNAQDFKEGLAARAGNIKNVFGKGVFGSATKNS